jgi:hypothetical protein
MRQEVQVPGPSNCRLEDTDYQARQLPALSLLTIDIPSDSQEGAPLEKQTCAATCQTCATGWVEHQAAALAQAAAHDHACEICIISTQSTSTRMSRVKKIIKQALLLVHPDKSTTGLDMNTVA